MLLQQIDKPEIRQRFIPQAGNMHIVMAVEQSCRIDDSFHLRAVLGVSIFWTTPIGPLRFNFTKAILKEDYDKEQNFDLTVSTNF